MHTTVINDTHLHGFKAVIAITSFWLGLAVVEAAESFSEFNTARTSRHSTQTWAVPVDLSRC